MKTATVMIWFEGDVGPASIEYDKTFKGNGVTACNRFLKEAMLKFPRHDRIEVEVA